MAFDFGNSEETLVLTPSSNYGRFSWYIGFFFTLDQVFFIILGFQSFVLSVPDEDSEKH